MPSTLKDALERAAVSNGRSLTAEIVTRLTESIEIDAMAESPAASFDAMKPVLEAVRNEVSDSYEKRFDAIEALLAEVNERFKTVYNAPKNTKSPDEAE